MRQSCQTLNTFSTYQPTLGLEGCVESGDLDRLRKIFRMAWRRLAILFLIKTLGHGYLLDKIRTYLTKWEFKSHGRATIGRAMKGQADRLSCCDKHVQVGVLGRWRINVGDMRHRLIADLDCVSPATNLPLNLPLAAPQGPRGKCRRPLVTPGYP